MNSLFPLNSHRIVPTQIQTFFSLQYLTLFNSQILYSEALEFLKALKLLFLFLLIPLEMDDVVCQNNIYLFIMNNLTKYTFYRIYDELTSLVYFWGGARVSLEPKATLSLAALSLSLICYLIICFSWNRI